MVDKVFKTHRQQIKGLRSKGMDIPQGSGGSEAMRILERYNYYDLINGYNTLFLESTAPDKYKTGVKITEIEELYKINAYISKEIFGLIMNYEKRLKNKCAYFYSKEFKDENYPYLNYANYNSSNDYFKSMATVTIRNFAEKISGYSQSKHKGTPVYHYSHQKSNIPLWVVIERMTLGNVNYFHQVLPNDGNNSIRTKIAEAFRDDFNRASTNLYLSRDFLNSKFIDQSNHLANIFRNISAHGERVYAAYVNNFTDFDMKRKVADYFSFDPEIFRRRKGHLLELLTFLFFLTDRYIYKECVLNIKNYIDTVFEAELIFTISKEELLESMGFIEGLKIEDIILGNDL